MIRIRNIILSLAVLTISSVSFADQILPLDPRGIAVFDRDDITISDKPAEKNTGFIYVYSVTTKPGEAGCTFVMQTNEGGLIWIKTDSDRLRIILANRAGQKDPEQRTLVRYTGNGTNSSPGTATEFQY